MQDQYTDYVSHIEECTDTSGDRSYPLLQWTIDLWKITTLVQTDPIPPPINKRSMQDHYTDYVSHIEECTDTSGDRSHPLLQWTIDLWKITTLVQTDPTPPPINKRSMQDLYTDYVSHIDVFTDTSADRPQPLLQLTKDLWKTITLNKCHI